MQSVANSIINKRVDKGKLIIFWLGQAGFVFKTDNGTIIYIDPYLSNCVERLYGFKRIMASVVEPHEVVADYIITTHRHEDHLDIDAIPEIASNCNAKFVGPPQCMEMCCKLGVSRSRLIEVVNDDEKQLNGIKLFAVYADHGELAPEAIGVILDFRFVRVYVTGDTAYSPRKMEKTISLKSQIIIPVINGRFGNMNSEEAAMLTRDVQAKIAIPCHYWMFAEHNGAPGSFISACHEFAPQTQVVILGQGKEYTYIKS